MKVFDAVADVDFVLQLFPQPVYVVRIEIKRTGETYLFDFDGDLYGDVLRVRFLHRIRDERKFNGIDELKAQIERDSRHALNYFKTQGVRNMLEIL